MAETLSIAAKVAARVKSLGAPAVEEAAIGIMAERTLKKRTDAVIVVVDKIDSSERELRKLVADQVTYDETGKKTGETFSKTVVEARAKITQFLGKLRKALDKALPPDGGDSDFGDVLSLANDKGG